ncbi:MAG: hypothetical protein ABL983_05720 [Nitrospira sp.]
MSLLEQLKEFKTVSGLAQLLRAQNPGFNNVPELAMLYSHSIMDAINYQNHDHACRLYRLALTA